MSAVAPPATGELTKEQLLEAYRVMRTIREFEERLHTRVRDRARSPASCTSTPARRRSPPACCAHLRADDYIASTHRGHGHAIAKGCDVKGMMAEIYGKTTGICHGKGGSMHIADLAKGMLGANGIVGGGPPLVCGVGLTAKVTRHRPGRRLLHRRRRLQPGHVPREPEPRRELAPARASSSSRTTATPRRPRRNYHQTGIDVAKRADGFGMPGVIVDGLDFFAVHEAAGEAIAPRPRRRRPDAARVQGRSATTATSRATSRPTAAPDEVEDAAPRPRLPGRVRAAA